MDKAHTFFVKKRFLKLFFSALFLFSFSLSLYSQTPPVVNKIPDVNTLCAQALVSVDIVGTPQAGCNCHYEQQRKLPNSSSWVNMTVGDELNVGYTEGVVSIRVRMVCTGGAGCGTSDWTEVSWNVVKKPTPPTSFILEPNSTVCTDALLTITAEGGSGGTGSCHYLYAGSYNSSLSHFATLDWTTENTFVADETGNFYARARFYCDGYGCDTSSISGSAYWSVYNKPNAANLVKTPNTDGVCVGGIVGISATSGSHGQGTCTDYFRYSDDGGNTWSDKLTSRPTITASNEGQIIIIEAWRECTGEGCETSDTNSVFWNTVADPVWGEISVSKDEICRGGSVELNGEFIGGVGGFIRWYRATTPTGMGNQVTSPNTPNAANTYYYYPTYVASPTNTGCSLDPPTERAQLLVVNKPTWGTTTLSPTELCQGGEVNFSTTVNGGLGGDIQWVRADVSNGTGSNVTSPDVPPAVSEYFYRPQFIPAGSDDGCDLADGAEFLVTVYDSPTPQTITGTPEIGSSICIGGSVSATFSGDINSSIEIDEYQYSTDAGNNWSDYTPGTSVTSTEVGSESVQIRTRRVSTDGSCESEWVVATWNVVPQPTAPSLNTKTPNLESICDGAIVSATINAGSGGIDCSDILEYSLNSGSTWTPYTAGQNISTAGATAVIIRGSRGNCNTALGCDASDWATIAEWTVTNVEAATLSLTPNSTEVCVGENVSATLDMPGSGGDGCTDIFQYRYEMSGAWSAWFPYTLGNNISSAGKTKIQVRAVRNCPPVSGCTDENVYTWEVNNFVVVSPTMTKQPNLASVCEGTDVRAIVQTSGSGGLGCSDIFKYRIDEGAWNDYLPGSDISTVGANSIEIISYRADCDPGGICGDSVVYSYTWSVEPQPAMPDLIPNILEDNICAGDIVSATITPGDGGVGCINYSQYRLLTAGNWSAWYNYNSGQNIATIGRQGVEIRAWQGNCSAGAGCLSSDTVLKTWTVLPNLVNPTITKVPNRLSICEEETVTAALINAGSGGLDCSDIFEFRTFDGSSWSEWSAFALGDPISGLGTTKIEIRAYRGDCYPGSSCNNPDPNVISWNVVPSATNPMVTRVPDEDFVCSGDNVSATIVDGTDGISCYNYRQYRYHNGTNWSSWYTYVPGNNITTIGRTQIEVRAFRGCQASTGCESSDTISVSWNVVQGVQHPIMAKQPNATTVCQGTDLMAMLSTPGSGGSDCIDQFEIRFNEGMWMSYNPGDNIGTDNSITKVEVKAIRTDCLGGLICGNPDGNIYTWLLEPQPVAPDLIKNPNQEYVCSGETVSATTVPGSGYSCSDYFQYRRYNENSSSWSAWMLYISDYQIQTTGFSQIEIRAFNHNCNPTTGCIPDTNLISWNIIPKVSNPSITKSPNIVEVCQGATVSADVVFGTGGIDCSDFAEYSVDGGNNWNFYNPNDLINTIGLSSVIIRAYTADCNPLFDCPTSDTISVSWIIQESPMPPIISRFPDQDVVCAGASVKGDITPGSGGVQCNDVYQYRYNSASGWSSWSTYPNGYNISTSGGRTEIEIRAYRTCSGYACDASDTAFVSWIIDPTLVNPSIEKTPNFAQVCEGTDISAHITVPGSGGTDCQDIMEFSMDNGLSWNSYNSGDNISTYGLSSVIVRAYRGACLGGGACTPTDTNQVSWTIVPMPIMPSIDLIPHTGVVCHGEEIKANITNGTGGISCADFAQYRINNNGTWTGWYNYTSGSNINYSANAIEVEVRAFRGNCGNGCAASDTMIAHWTIVPSLINPILSQNPSQTNVVSGMDVSASIDVPGSNGVSCSDILEMRTGVGGTYSDWYAYMPNSAISTIGVDEIQVRGFRGSCTSGDECPPMDTLIYSWFVVEGPQAPDVIKNPDNDVCSGELISATITPNNGGIGCEDFAQYRYFTGTWSAWTNYVSDSPITYPVDATLVEVKAWRGNCDPISGALSSDTVFVSWNIIPTMVNPILEKYPDVAQVCQGVDVSASITTPGNGGNSCSDILQFRVNNGLDYTEWTHYLEGSNISTHGLTQVEIRGFRGDCLSGPECPPADTLVYTWQVEESAIAPTITPIPNTENVCYGAPVSADITPGSGGIDCEEIYQYRLFDGSTWSAWNAYISGENIEYLASTTKIELQVQRGNCDVSSGCDNSLINSVSWNIIPSLANPILTKNPNFESVCGGVDVSASIATAGSGGIGCSDILQFRTNSGGGFGEWATYLEGSPINTNELTQVEIRGYRGDCLAADECPPQDTTIYSWIITPGPQAPTITKLPDENQVCRGTEISAQITEGYGGGGCSDVYEYRLFDGSTWSSATEYISGSPINYLANTEQVEVTVYRGNCDASSGCIDSDVNIATWEILEYMTNPILEKHPDVNTICSGTDVSATIVTPGSGGVGCSDLLEYRFDSGSGFGAWNTYMEGDFINTDSYIAIQIRGTHTNCISGDECPPTDNIIYEWSIMPAPIQPTITKIPNQDEICFGENISALVTPGSGGDDCEEIYEYRTFNGGWSAWLPYVSETNINYIANTDSVVIRAFRADCNPLSGCGSSDTSSVKWAIIENIAFPTLTQNPDVAAICEGTDVSASVATAGSGGVGCSDILEFRTKVGTSYSVWSTYLEADLIPSFGVDEIQVRAYVGNCISGDQCAPEDTLIYSWTVTPQPTAPVIAKNPDVENICSGSIISANITPGTGGSNCSEIYEYRLFNGTWGAWTSYTSGSNINYGDATMVEVQAKRGNCDASSGCTESDVSTVQWNVFPQPISPTIEKAPNLASVCEGTNVMANLANAGSGGIDCSDIYEFRTKTGSIWSEWLTYIPGDAISTTSFTEIEVRAYRGNCQAGSQCNESEPNLVSWIIEEAPVAPILSRIPDEDNLCANTDVAASAVAGYNGVSCEDKFESRTFNGSIWSNWVTYIPTNQINTNGIDTVEIRGFRLCDPLAGCGNSDTNLVSWNIYPEIVMPEMTKVPDVDNVCEGTDVKAEIVQNGSGGATCSDIYEYRLSGGTWTAYVPGNDIPTLGETEVEVRYYRGGCPEADDCGVVPIVLSWTISQTPTNPSISKTPDFDEICDQSSVQAEITPGSGGEFCSDFAEYRTYNGTDWTNWISYTSNQDIATAGIEKVEVKAWRGNCSSLPECSVSDTIFASWTIYPQPIAPQMQKEPDENIVCEGTDVWADLITAGSGGNNCEDIFLYRTNDGNTWTAWENYIPGTHIETTGIKDIEISYTRGNCDAAEACNTVPVEVLSWTTGQAPTNPSINKTPNQDHICYGTLPRASITNGTGGVGCSNKSQYRMYNGETDTWTNWTSYMSGIPILHGPDIDTIQVRAWRGDCLTVGCESSDTVVVSWNVIKPIINPVLTKIPDENSICSQSNVSAIVQTPGSGGASCEDAFQYRTDSGSGFGVWQDYIPGTDIPTAGNVAIEIMSFRDNCDNTIICGDADPNIVSWTIYEAPTNPLIAKTPDLENVCYGTSLSAEITPGTEGNNCSDFAQVRRFNGVDWSAWQNYTSNANITYAANVEIVEVRAWRGNCEGDINCAVSDTIVASWNIIPKAIAPEIEKLIDLEGVCEGAEVAAILVTAGGEGIGCSDFFQYRTNNGTTWTAWQDYTLGSDIATIGLSEVEIRAFRGDCDDANCEIADTNKLHWNVSEQPTMPTIIRLPDQDELCGGTLVSATIGNGTTENGCNNISEYRTQTNGAWSSWMVYVSENQINTIGLDSVEIRTYSVCPPETGCASTDTALVSWNILSDIIMPVVVKNIDLDSVCAGTDLYADSISAGSGGETCEDVYEYSIDDGATWLNYVPGQIISTETIDKLIIRYYRGNCPEAAVCGTTISELTWVIEPTPIDPLITRIPDIDNICEGTNVAANITPGSGGVSCENVYQYRTYDGTDWSIWLDYISDTEINITGLQQVEVRAYLDNCGATCDAGDPVLVSWNIFEQAVAPIMEKVPNFNKICEGDDVMANLVAAGTGGAGCEDYFQYRTHDGTDYSIWQDYIPGDAISTVGLSEIQISYGRGNCDPASLCTETEVNTLTWEIVPQPTSPTISKTPTADDICFGTFPRASITPGTGGVDCTNKSQYRMYNSETETWSNWISYFSGIPVLYGPDISIVEIRAFRGDCQETCFTPDTAVVSWNIWLEAVNPVLVANPDVPYECEGAELVAELVNAGFGGANCEDVFEYRIDQGSGYGDWQEYTPGTTIQTIGVEQVQVVGYRGNCQATIDCGSSIPDTITWIINPTPIAPQITPLPDVANICESEDITAIITPGSGGVSCIDIVQYRTFDGSNWSTPSDYTSGDVITYPAGTQIVELQAWRGDCDEFTSCQNSEINSVQWNIHPEPIAPIIAKNPDISGLCQGVVSATLIEAGSGGVDCSDIYEYRVDDGSGFGSWSAYNLEDEILIDNYVEVQIRAYRGNCAAYGCDDSPENILSWTKADPVVGPEISRNPDQDVVCQGQMISAIIIPGSGGAECDDVYEYRTNDGVQWSEWFIYNVLDEINTIGLTNVEIRAYRDCNPISNCPSTPETLVAWEVSDGFILPVMEKVPNVWGVCQGADVSADLISAGMGGDTNCEDIFEYRTYAGGTWTDWNTYTPSTDINTAGLDSVQISYTRGNCPDVDICGPASTNYFTWYVAPQPTAPIITRVPDVDVVCVTEDLMALITEGTGGIDCSDVYEYQTFDGAWSGWETYINEDIVDISPTTTALQIRAYRDNCNPLSSCTSSSIYLVEWTIEPEIISPEMIKVPDTDYVCDYETVSAELVNAGSGGNACSDIFEYRTDYGNGFGSWMPYVPGDELITLGLANIEIRFNRENCQLPNACPEPTETIFSWNVSTPPIPATLSRVPDVDTLCFGPQLSITTIAGSGGDNCVDVYEYRLTENGVLTDWMSFNPTSIIDTDSTITSVEVRTFRGECDDNIQCGITDTNSVTWIVLPQLTPPIITKLPDQDAVCEGAQLSATAISEGGEYGSIWYDYSYMNPNENTWNNGNSFVPNQHGMAYIRVRANTTTLGCESTQWEWASWIVDEKPQVSVSGDMTICENTTADVQAFVADGYGVSNVQWQYSTDGCSGPWTDYGDIVQANEVFTTPILTQTTYLQAIVSQEGSACNVVSDCITIDVLPNPGVSITGITEFCSGDDAVLTAQINNPPASFSYLWQNASSSTGPWSSIAGANGSTISVPADAINKWIRLIIISDSQSCNDTSNVVYLQDGNAPLFTNVPSNMAGCLNQDVSIDVEVQSSPVATYQWFGPNGLIVGEESESLNLTNIQLSDEGLYYIVATNNCGTTTSENIYLDVLGNIIYPTTIVGDNTICHGVTTSQYSTDGDNILSQTWHISPVSAGTINDGLVVWNPDFMGDATIFVQTTACNAPPMALETVVSVIPSVETPTISGPSVHCVGAGTDQYTATAQGATSFTWTIANAGNSTIDNNGLVTWDADFHGVAIISVIADGCNGPSDFAQFEVHSADDLTYTSTGNINVCEDNSALLEITANPPVGNSYQWYNQDGEIVGETENTLTIPNVGMDDSGSFYYCQITSFCGDVVTTDNDTLFVRPNPQALFTHSGACQFDTVYFFNNSTVSEGSLGYIWSFGDGSSTDENPAHIYIEDTTYTVQLTVISEYGCQEIYTEEIIINELPTATLTSHADSCYGSGQGSIVVVPTAGTPPYQYNINGGDFQEEGLFTDLMAGEYVVGIVDSNGCFNSYITQVNQAHEIYTHIYPSNALCHDDSSAVALLEIIGGTEPYTVTWSNGDETRNLIDVPAGNYEVVVVDANGCMAYDTVYLTQPNPIIIDSIIVHPSCMQLEDGKIFVSASGGTGEYSYLWSTDAVEDSIVNLQAGFYYLTVTDEHGCETVKAYKLNKPEEDCLTIWTSFSPDGDGVNDVWNIGNIDLYPDCKVEIFNRWGNKIFESKGYYEPWDGTWNGKPLPEETYYYAITLGDGRRPFTGTVTIIR